MSKRLAVFRTVFFYLKVVWIKNAKIDFFKYKNGFESSFYKIDVRWLQTGLSVLKMPNFAYGGFLRIFKMLHFSKFFEIFEIYQYFLVKLLNALNFIWTL